ncbi:hypothetical protein V8C35DRAFT_256419 [Trichoderma chlorosporum]
MDTKMAIDADLPKVLMNSHDANKYSLECLKSAKATIEKTITQYEYQLQDEEELPNEFIEANACLSRTKDALDHSINNLNWDEPPNDQIQLLAAGVESKSNKLQDIFKQVAVAVRKAKDITVSSSYITVLQSLPNPGSHQVEVLMLGILRELEELFSMKPLKPNCSQNFELKDVIEKISKVKSSVQESGYTKSGANNIQNNSHGATGHQYNGKEHHIFSGTGAVTINNHHVWLYRDDETWRNRSPVPYMPPHHDERNRTPDGSLIPSGEVVGHSEGITIKGGRPPGREDFQIAIIRELPPEYDVVYFSTNFGMRMSRTAEPAAIQTHTQPVAWDSTMLCLYFFPTWGLLLRLEQRRASGQAIPACSSLF